MEEEEENKKNQDFSVLNINYKMHADLVYFSFLNKYWCICVYVSMYESVCVCVCVCICVYVHSIL